MNLEELDLTSQELVALEEAVENLFEFKNDLAFDDFPHTQNESVVLSKEELEEARKSCSNGLDELLVVHSLLIKIKVLTSS